MTKRERLSFLAGFPLLSTMLFIAGRYFIRSDIPLPQCAVYRLTGFWCPGCGNTRCVKALLAGNILLAMRNNLLIPFLLFCLGVLYIENAFALAGKNVNLLPRNFVFWMCVIAFFTIYYVMRNFFPAIAPI